MQIFPTAGQIVLYLISSRLSSESLHVRRTGLNLLQDLCGSQFLSEVLWSLRHQLSHPSSDEKQTLWIDSIAFCLRCVTIYSHQVFFFSFATSNSRKFQSEKVQMTKSVQKDRKWIYNKFRLYSRKSKNTQTVQRPPECLRGRGSRYGTAGPGPEGALSITSRTRSISRFVRAGSKEFNWNEAAFPSFSSWKPVIDLYNMSHWATPPEWTSNVKRKVTISHWIL